MIQLIPEITATVAYKTKCSKCGKTVVCKTFELNLGPVPYELSINDTYLPFGWVAHEVWQLCEMCKEPFEAELTELHMKLHKYIHGYRPDRPNER